MLAIVLVLDLLGAGKVEKVRSGVCDIVDVDCDWVCMASSTKDEDIKMMELVVCLLRNRNASTSTTSHGR